MPPGAIRTTWPILPNQWLCCGIAHCPMCWDCLWWWVLPWLHPLPLVMSVAVVTSTPPVDECCRGYIHSPCWWVLPWLHPLPLLMSVAMVTSTPPGDECCRGYIHSPCWWVLPWLQDTNVEELQAELPEHMPRFLVLSYVRNHGDGRISYPLCFIYISPSGRIALSSLDRLDKHIQIYNYKYVSYNNRFYKFI